MDNELVNKLLKRRSIIICLNGDNFSGEFIKNLMDVIAYIHHRDGRVSITHHSNPMHNQSLNKLLVGNVTLGPDQYLFGDIYHDYILWIDSTVSSFSGEDFGQLVNMDTSIASGWHTERGGNTSVVEKTDQKFFQRWGVRNTVSLEEMEQKEDVFNAEFIDLGFCLMRENVMKTLQYPWFKPRMVEVAPGHEDMSSATEALCMDLRDQDLLIKVNPKVRVGVERRLIL